jgi:hypothetical protein
MLFRSTPLRTLALLLLPVLSARAQTEVVTDAVAPIVPPDLRPAVGSLPAGPGSIESTIFPPPSPFVWGPFSLDTNLSDRFVYATGLQVRPGQGSSTYINSLSAGVSGDVGTHWTFAYTPSWTTYSNKIFNDSVDQSASIAGAFFQDNWGVKISQSYNSSHASLIETAEQTYQQVYVTGIDVSHNLNDEIYVEDSFSQVIRRVDPPPESYEWTNVDWLHYRFSSGIDTAIGVGLGYLETHPGVDSEYIQPQAEVSYPLGTKISMSLHGGYEDREFLGTPTHKLGSPIYGASLNYLPFDATEISISGNRQVQPSFFADQVTRTTSWDATLSQRLLGHFLFSAGIGYQKSDYIAEVSDFPVARNDDTRFYNFKLSTSFLGRGTIEIFYNHNQNSSNQAGFTFASSQEGVQLGFRY